MEHVKVVAVGDGMVGKTCMLMSYTTDTFPSGYVPTVFDNYQAMIMHNKKPLSVAFWDTAGQEDYDRLRHLSYPNTDVFLVCYSVTSQTSVNNIVDKWLPELRHYIPDATVLAVGTKADIRKTPEVVQKLERRGHKLVNFEATKRKLEAAGVSEVMECSAKTQDGLADVVGKALDMVMSKRHAKPRRPRRRQVCAIL